MENISNWIEKQRILLNLEKESEKEQLLEKLNTLTPQECQENGISLLSLEIESTSTSLFGRIKYKIIKKDKKEFPINSFKVGDEVQLYETKRISNNSNNHNNSSKEENVVLNGIVSKVTSTYIEIVSDESDGTDFIPPLRLDMKASEATHIKMVHALNDLSNLDNSPAWPLVNHLFYNTPLQECVPNREITPFNQNLNESQINAVNYALCAQHLALIHGPPGTGKTTAVVELIYQAIALNLKILVCAPSNVAVDNILERLVSIGTVQSTRTTSNISSSSSSSFSSNQVTPRVVRLGHPARISEAIQSHCLDALISTDEGTEIVDDVRKEIDTSLKALSKAKSKKDRNLQRELQAEIRNLRKEIRQREEKVVTQIMETRNVILCTLVGASSRQLRGIEFDLVIIDEAAQALEVACWIPMLHTSKVVLAGDHCQLPPTIKSVEAERLGLGVTLFERIITTNSLMSCAKLLDIQYRMNREISEWSSHEMYQDRLRSHESNSNHTLSDLFDSKVSLKSNSNDSNSDLEELSKTVMLLIDTAGCGMEEDGCRGGSYRNTAEAEIVIAHIYRLYELGLKPEQIGVITPYNGQLELLRELLTAKEDAVNGVTLTDGIKRDPSEKSKLEIRTVDGFQGGEKEAIILSLVRSNQAKEVGFLAEKRRINVAVTRAKRHLVIVCDSDTCSNDRFIGRLLTHIGERGEHRSALEYLQSLGITLTTNTSIITDDYSQHLTFLPPPPTTTTSSLSTSLSTSLSASLITPPIKKNDSKMTQQSKKNTLPQEKKNIHNESKKLSISKKKEQNDSQLQKNNKSNNLNSNLVDPFNIHIENILNYFLSKKIIGGIIGNGALRILSTNNNYLGNTTTVIDDDDKIKFYSNLITPRNNQDNVLTFPSSLNSHQRLTIHTIAESINTKNSNIKKENNNNNDNNDNKEDDNEDEEIIGILLHESIGEGSDRKIEVRIQYPTIENHELNLHQNNDNSNNSNNIPIITLNKFSNISDELNLDHNNENDSDNSDSDENNKKEVTRISNSKTSIESQTIKSDKTKESTNLISNKSKKQNNNNNNNNKQNSKKQNVKEDKVLSGIKAGLSEDELLEEAIRANMEHANYNKYRLGSAPIPNPEKVRAAETLRNQIAQSQLARAGESRKNTLESGNNKDSNKKKVLKKPPRNFGGGKVGGS